MLYSKNEGKAGWNILDENKRRKQNKVFSHIKNTLAYTFSDNVHINRNAGIQIFIVTVAFIMLVRIFPMGSIQSHTYSKQGAFDLAAREALVGDVFTTNDKKLQTVYFQEEHIFQITLYMNCKEAKEGIVQFRLYDDKFSCIYEEEISCIKIESKGYLRASPDLDVEKNRNYYYEVLIPEGTSAQFELPVADRSALGQHENSSLYIDGIINDEVCLIADFDYTSPLSVMRIVLYDLLIVSIALAVYILVHVIVAAYDAYFDKFGVTIFHIKIFRIVSSGLIGIGAIVFIVFSVILNKFGGEIWDRLFFLIGILAGAAWLLAAVWIPAWYPKQTKPQKMSVRSKFSLIWRNYIQTVCFALLFYALCQYVNADRLYYQRTNTRWMLIFLAVAFLMSCSEKQFANMFSLGWLVLGILGSSAYLLNINGDEQARMIARLNCGVTVTWGLLVVNILLMLAHKRNFAINIKKNWIRILHIVFLFVFIILMYINRFEKMWVYTATLPFIALFFIKGKDMANIRFLKNFTNGILLSFGFVTLFSLVHRPHHYWMLYRYGGLFHTVACTGMYLAVVFSATLAKLYGKIKDRKKMFVRCPAEYFMVACTVGFILLTMSKTALFTTVITVVAIVVLTAIAYHKNIKRIMMEIGVLTFVCIISFPMVFTVVRTVPALINDPVRYDIEFQDQSFMLYKGDPIDSEKYMTVRRFFSVFFGRFHEETGEEAASGLVLQEGGVLAYTGQSFAGIDMRAANETNTSEEAEETEDSWDVSNGRFEIFRAYLKEMGLKGHPQMGPEDENGSEYAHAHNSYLQVAYNFGVIAGGIFLALCVLALYRAILLFYKQGRRFGISLVPFSLIVAFGVVSLTEWAFHPCIPLGFCFILMQAFLIKAEE